jgi:hypothetical protein
MPSQTRADRILGLFARLSCRRATNDDDLDQIATLRYRAYRHAGMIDGLKSGRLTDDFDRVANGFVIGLWQDDRPIASVRIHLAARDGTASSPAVQTFADILGPCLDAGLRILDPNRLAIDPQAGLSDPDLHLALMRIPMMAAQHFGAHIVTATARPEHQAFYARIFRMQVAAPPRPYPMLNRPLGLMMGQVSTELTQVQLRHTYLIPAPGEGAALFGTYP